jgi:GNAT superfamily N-acetyltransferase
VLEDKRSGGLGTRLMNELAEAARTAGFARLSLSVDAEDPARRFYGRLGYREIATDEGGVRMIFGPRVPERASRKCAG